MAMNVKIYSSMINNIEKGEHFYFNAINATIAMIEYTKELIANGYIAPVQEELNKVIKPEYHEDFLTGKSIAPQMEYVKLK